MVPSSTCVLLAVLAFTTLIVAERVSFEPCSGGMKNCEVNWVEIDPCAEAATGNPCRTKKGKVSSIKFNYATSVPKDKMEVRVFWASATGDLPFAGLDPDACSVTQCPVEADHPQNLTYSLTIPKMTSSRVYNVKWDLHDDDKEVQCCFLTKIRIV
ncbi:MD-2-related lipid-recognition protein-like [Neocloeon triangulifer]|uniref:MD-2-related lipid-recognition protein-like n=1 Tax=Neocloeon triangulifer TaxID=2078957 RepID=UPI00286F853E|nr:MD-2-related lipid-recognition protein-like [Neocloeon triangulifer]